MKTITSQKNNSNWKNFTTKEVFEFLPTGSHSRENMEIEISNSDEKIFNIHYGDIHTKYKNYIDPDIENIPYLKDSADHRFNMLLQSGDVIMVDASEDYEGVGKATEIINIKDKKIIAGLHVFALRPNKKLVTNKFGVLSLQNPSTILEMRGASTYSKVYGISKKSFEKINITLPPLPEQNRIVQVLETWDKVIEKLNKKIEIKKNIKKFLMSDLLSGKKRLKGFGRKWEIFKLLELCEIKKGEQLNRDNLFAEGKYPAMNGGVSESGFTDKYNTEENTITISEGGNSCGYVNFNKTKFWRGGHCYAIVPSQKVFKLFLFQKLKFLEKNIMQLRVGSGLPNIQKSTLEKLKVNLPEIKEQKAIAEILMKADEEISGLERKLVVIKKQKKYLLNNLITGKIRTPETLSIQT